MFDLTKQIQLEGKSLKEYAYLRILLYLLFFAFALFVAYRIMFPQISLIFSFDNVNSLKNTLVSVRTSFQPAGLKKGNLSANDPLLFNANPVGSFSIAKLTFVAVNTSSKIDSATASMNKSYQAFLFPIGDPIGFRDSTLLASEGSYYIVSNGTLRKFSDDSLVTALGYAKGSFMPVSPSDLIYNKNGLDITDTKTYPDNTFFIIGDTYYELQNQQLYPFISTPAFLSQFDAVQAIKKENDFLSLYTVSESQLGFADGTLASSDISVFILSEGKSYPIINAATFVQMGFDWNNVVPLDSEELSLYATQKQFTHDQSHPNGTLFLDQETNTYYVIKNGQKLPIKSSAVLATFSKQKPVLASLRQSQQLVSCQLKKSFWNSNKYSCILPLDSIGNLIGNDYQIKVVFPDGTQINNMDMTFSTALKWESLRSSLSRIKINLTNNYMPVQQ